MPSSSGTPHAGEAGVSALDEQLTAMGFHCAIGVPDSHLTAIVARLGDRIPVHVAPREDVAVAVACGVVLAGQRPLLYMKNAGLFAAGDALVSLAADLRLWLTLLVGWAGTGTDTLPHHVVTGERTTALLEALGIAWRSADELAAAGDGAQWAQHCRDLARHSAILVSPGGGHGQ